MDGSRRLYQYGVVEAFSSRYCSVNLRRKNKIMHYTPRQHHCLVLRHIFSLVSRYLTRPLVRPICLSVCSQVIEKVCIGKERNKRCISRFVLQIILCC